MSRVGLRPVKLSEWVIGQAEAISQGTKTDTCCDVQALHNRAATSLARLWQQQDKRQDAYALLAPVYGWLCVQRRLACSVGDSLTRVRIRSPVAWMAGERETQPPKPIDKAILGMVASHRAAA